MGYGDPGEKCDGCGRIDCLCMTWPDELEQMVVEGEAKREDEATSNSPQPSPQQKLLELRDHCIAAAHKCMEDEPENVVEIQAWLDSAQKANAIREDIATEARDQFVYGLRPIRRARE